MFRNNDFSDEPKIQTAGVLPMRRPAENHPALKGSDSALRVMTDFTSKPAITVPPDCPIDAALADMARLGVRALLVAKVGSVIGLVTSYDIEGNRPSRFAAQAPLRRREDIRVSDIMTPWKDLPTLDWHTVQTAKILDMLEIFDGVGVMHLLVVENDANGCEVVRGLISRSRIERQLQSAQPLPRLAGSTPQRSTRSGEKH
jgi:CBS domain-containing protein